MKYLVILNITNLDLNYQNNEFIIDNFDNSFEKMTVLKDENDDNGSKNSEGFNKTFRPITNKQKLLVGEIKNNIDIYIKDFNNYFFLNFFQRIFDKIQDAIHEKNEKKESINISFNQQIKEMESLLDQGNKNIIYQFI